MIVRSASSILIAVLLLAGTAQAQTPSATPATGKTELQWFAQSAFKLTTPGGKVLMIDPWLTGNPKTPPEYKDLDKLGKIDLILVTHGHGDHFGDAVELAKKNNVPVLGTAGMGQTLQVMGILPPALSVRMNKTGAIQPFDGVKITQVHSDHSSEMVLKDRRRGKTAPWRRAGRHMIQLENGFKIWHGRHRLVH